MKFAKLIYFMYGILWKNLTSFWCKLDFNLKKHFKSSLLASCTDWILKWKNWFLIFYYRKYGRGGGVNENLYGYPQTIYTEYFIFFPTNVFSYISIEEHVHYWMWYKVISYHCQLDIFEWFVVLKLAIASTFHYLLSPYCIFRCLPTITSNGFVFFTVPDPLFRVDEITMKWKNLFMTYCTCMTDWWKYVTMKIEISMHTLVQRRLDLG